MNSTQLNSTGKEESKNLIKLLASMFVWKHGIENSGLILQVLIKQSLFNPTFNNNN